MKRYEAYDSFLDIWVNDIPAHWETHRMKYLFHERSEKGYPDEPLLVASQNMGVVPKNVYGNRTVEAQKDLHLLKLVRVGDFVISLRSFQGGLAYAYYQGIISPAYTVLTPHEPITAGYFRYLAKSKLFIGLLTLCVTGIREGQNIDYEKLRNHLLPLPPRAEQDQIVRYLDWQVSKINRLIAAKRKQIELLKEQMCKVFSVSSLENQKVRLKRVCDLIFQPVDIRPDAMYCKTGMYNRGRGIFRREPMPGCELGDSMFQHIDRDQVMISGQFAWEGAAYITSEADEEGIVSHRYYLLKPTRLTPEYIWAYLMSDKGLLDMLICSHGSAGRNRPLNIEELLNTYIPLPNSEADEKRVISTVRALMYINRQKERVFQLYEQLRTRLISDVVTGQMDVRGIEVPEFDTEQDFADELEAEQSEESEVG
ncbi:MAG: restriction endonuclease subunit S [Bradymonadia bacterium]